MLRLTSRSFSAFASAAVVVCVAAPFAQAATVTGSVLDSTTSLPLVGVEVLIDGVDSGARTDMTGRFTAEVGEGERLFTFRRTGYSEQSVGPLPVAAEGETAVPASRLAPLPAEGEEVLMLDALEVSSEKLNSQSMSVGVQRFADVQVDILSADDFAKFGASDIAEAVINIPGVSLSGGKYPVVRGLNDRYVVTRLNGATMPSPDPDRPAVPLDVFPSGIFSSIETQKTHSPDTPGEASGGSIDLQLLSFPEERIIKFSVGTGYNSNSDSNFPRSPRTSTDDMLADGASERDFSDRPEAVFGPVSPLLLNPANPANVVADLNASLASVRSGLEPTRERPGPDFNASLLLGDTFTFDDGKRVGVFVALNQSTKNRYESQSVSSTGSLDDGGATTSLGGGANNGFMVNEWGATREIGKREAQVSAVAGVGLEFSPGKQINYGYLFSRNAVDEAVLQSGGNRWRTDGQGIPSEQTFDGQDPSVGAPSQASYGYSAYTQREFEAQQLGGELDYRDAPLGTLFDWSYLAANNEQLEPDTYDGRGVGYRFRRETLQDSDVLAINATIDLTRHFSALDFGRGHDLKVGIYEEGSQRTFEQRQQQLVRSTTSAGGGQIIISNRWVDRTLAAPVLINGELFNPPAGVTGQADGERDISGYYAQLDTRPNRWLQVVGGLRVEDTQLSYTGFGFTPDPNNASLIYAPSLIEPSPIDQTDYIPSVNVNFDVTEEFKIRLAYSRTVARPTYRELQPFPLLNVLTNEVEVGNAGFMQTGFAPNPTIPVISDQFASYRGLTMAKVENYDLRFEWYPAEDAQVAFGVFYKKVGNPIERVQAVQQNFSAPVYTFVNNENDADLFGIEIEAQHNLGTLFNTPALDFLYMGANVTLIDATVDRTALESEAVNLETDIDQNDISRSRSLYDQPDLIANLFATATFDRIGGELTLSLNHTGERLVGALGAGGPDIYEDAVSSLNLVYTQRFKRYDGLSMKFAAKNLNDPTYRRIAKSGDSSVPFFDENGNAIGERALESYKEGVSYSVSVGYEF